MPLGCPQTGPFPVNCSRHLVFKGKLPPVMDVSCFIVFAEHVLLPKVIHFLFRRIVLQMSIYRWPCVNHGFGILDFIICGFQTGSPLPSEPDRSCALVGSIGLSEALRVLFGPQNAAHSCLKLGGILRATEAVFWCAQPLQHSESPPFGFVGWCTSISGAGEGRRESKGRNPGR